MELVTLITPSLDDHDHNSDYASAVHTHTESDITDFGNYSVVGHSHASDEVDWTQDQYPSEIHLGNIPDLSSVYSIAGHSHASDEVDWTIDQYPDEIHLGNIPDLSGVYSIVGHSHAHSDTTGQGTDDHHAQSHTITSHSDITDATGAQLEELTGGGSTSLHFHTSDEVDWTIDQYPDEIHLGNIPDLSGVYSITSHSHASDEVDWTIDQYPDEVHLGNIPDLSGVYSIAGHVHAHSDITDDEPNQHIDHSTVSVLAGTLLTGGGTIDGNVTLNVNEAGINHTAILNIGTNTHVQIDTHLALTEEHYDWTVDQYPSEVHFGNIPDLSGVYSVVGHNHNTIYYTQTQLGSNVNALGASLIGIEDSLSLYTATTVEAALAEVMDIVTPVTYTGDSISTETGNDDAGDIDSTKTINDDDTYDVSEVTGSPGWDIEITFIGITTGHEPNKIQLHMSYNGSNNHVVNFELWNYTGTPQFDVIAADAIVESAGVLTFYSIDITGNITDYVNGSGEAILRLHHSSGGNPTHDVSIDYAVLKDDTSGGGGFSDHGGMSGLQDDDHDTLYPNMSGRLGGQTIIGGLVTTETLTLKDNADDENTVIIGSTINLGALNLANQGTGHDGFSDYVVAEHYDWTVDQYPNEVNIGNIPDLSAVYSITSHVHNYIRNDANDTTTGTLTIEGIGDGGRTSYDLMVGDVDGTPTYGMIQFGNAVIGRTSYKAGNIDLDGSILFQNIGGPVTSKVEFCFAVSTGNSTRFALATAGVGHATYNSRSFLIAGPAPANTDFVTVGYWQTNNSIFHNLVCDTDSDGADLGVQNDLEVEGDIFADNFKESTTAAGITFNNDVVISGGTITGITDLAVADGGTGASNAGDARTNLGLAIGSDVQLWDAQLDDLATITSTAAQIDAHLVLTEEHLDWTIDAYPYNVHINNLPDLSGVYSIISHTHASDEVDWTVDQYPDEIHIGNIPDLSGVYSVISHAHTTADISDVSVTQVELSQLETIGATTISVAQWGYLGAMDQSLTSVDSPTFEALKLNDSDSSHTLAFHPTSNLTADRTISWQTGDKSFTFVIAGPLAEAGTINLGDWFNQSVRTGATVSFGTVNATNVSAGDIAIAGNSIEFDDTDGSDDFEIVATNNTNDALMILEPDSGFDLNDKPIVNDYVIVRSNGSTAGAEAKLGSFPLSSTRHFAGLWLAAENSTINPNLTNYAILAGTVASGGDVAFNSPGTTFPFRIQAVNQAKIYNNGGLAVGHVGYLTTPPNDGIYTEGLIKSNAGFQDAANAGIDGTFLDQGGNTIRVSGGIIYALT